LQVTIVYTNNEMKSPDDRATVIASDDEDVRSEKFEKGSREGSAPFETGRAVYAFLIANSHY